MVRDVLSARFMLIGCLAVVLAVVVTGDFVVDTAFEWVDVAAAVEPDAEPEEPEDSGEHLLMPSPKVEQGGGLTAFQLSPQGQLHVPIVLPCPSRDPRHSDATVIEFDRHPPPCFLLPLRI